MKTERWRIDGWGLSSAAVSATEPERATCLHCRTTLDLHQPDPGRPDRLLGLCDRCGGWHLIASSGRGLDILAIDRPGAAANGHEPAPLDRGTSPRL